jgi:LuxR family maltose regulon positive regulatory protein
MTALLRAAGAAKIEPAYVNGLLGARQGVPPVELHTSTAGASLIEPLSERERQVLRLLATDLGGPDIARELVVSLSTVRTHTRSIYAKLDVTSRRAAVRRADELDLLRATRP